MAGNKRDDSLKPSRFYRPLGGEQGLQLSLKFARECANRVQEEPLREELLLALKDATFHSIVSFRDLSTHCRSASDLTWARRCISLFKKDASIDLGVDTEAAAWEKFCEAEMRCADWNKALRTSKSRMNLHPRVNAWIHQASHKITSILKDCPTLSELQCSFGPGANTTCKRKTTARWKLSSVIGCSKEAFGTPLGDLIACYEPWLSGMEIQENCGELSFVPKTALTERTIMIEPLLNTFVQRGIGRVIKRRLLKSGVNLYDQGINRDRARMASMNGSHATLDLSSASDLISTRLVFELLPPEWFELLSNWRTGRVCYKKKGLEFNLEKFSSMGNGYTFELESLIFYSVCHVACTELGIDPDVSVYGDDLIVPTEAYPLVCEILDAFGFSVNQSKSFADGPFRESCGGDYLDGIDTRPFFKKDRWTFARLVGFHNDIYRSGFPDEALCLLIEQAIPKSFRLYGPDGYGDGHLLAGSFVGKPSGRNKGYCGHTFETFVKRAARDEDPCAGDSLLPAYTSYCYSESMPSAVASWLSVLGNVQLLTFADIDTVATYLDPYGSSRENDRYAIRGGESGRKIRVYTLT